MEESRHRKNRDWKNRDSGRIATGRSATGRFRDSGRIQGPKEKISRTVDGAKMDSRKNWRCRYVAKMDSRTIIGKEDSRRFAKIERRFAKISREDGVADSREVEDSRRWSCRFAKP